MMPNVGDALLSERESGSTRLNSSQSIVSPSRHSTALSIKATPTKDPNQLSAECGGFDIRRNLVQNMWYYETVHQQGSQADVKVSAHTQGSTSAWQADASSNHCFLCLQTFGWFHWRHHCRRCGELVCGSCSPFKGLGRTLKGAPDKVLTLVKRNAQQRVCSKCHLDAKTSTKASDRTRQEVLKQTR